MKDKKYDRELQRDANPIDETENYIITKESNEDVKCDNELTENESHEIFGTVVNCVKLNIRKKPTKDSESICTICVGTEIMIDLKESTDKWYKVYLAEGINGFCMKKYISIN